MRSEAKNQSIIVSKEISHNTHRERKRERERESEREAKRYS